MFVYEVPELYILDNNYATTIPLHSTLCIGIVISLWRWDPAIYHWTGCSVLVHRILHPLKIHPPRIHEVKPVSIFSLATASLLSP